MWWTPEDRRPGRASGRYAGPPELAVEVRSPSTWRYDVGTKKLLPGFVLGLAALFDR